MGGENRLEIEQTVREAGSSPRGRGKHYLALSTRTFGRLIPAWAGKTELPPGVEIWESAHPRVGGENLKAPPRPDSIFGSSPRGRGKPGELARRVGDAGLIPAWAGKTCRTSATASSRAAHPRVGGENAAVIWRNLVPHGSSPRGRGKQIKSLPYAEGIGLIPAWAGKTFHKSPSTRHNGAHPRVGGEN